MDVWLTWEQCVQHNIPIDQRSCSHLELLKVWFIIQLGVRPHSRIMEACRKDMPGSV